MQLSRIDSFQLSSTQMVDYFNIIKPVGKGGMGEVYLARDTKLGRKVALKIINSEFVVHKDDFKRFNFEAQVTASFNHPNIITIYDVGEYEGNPYFAMEYLEGESLYTRLQKERLSIWEIIRIALPVTSALVEAHANDILHRDLKPENIFLPKDGRLRVLDFGLAHYMGTAVLTKADDYKNQTNNQSVLSKKARGDTQVLNIKKQNVDCKNSTISAVQKIRIEKNKYYQSDAYQQTLENSNERLETTKQNRFDSNQKIEQTEFSSIKVNQPYETQYTKGTPPYMAPEIWKGSKPDNKADIFALGVLLYEMVTGKKPFKADNFFQLALNISSSEQAPLLPENIGSDLIPLQFRQLVARCLDKSKHNRPAAFEIKKTFNDLLLKKDGYSLREINPFRGLRPFLEENSSFFFGRDDEINQFLEKIRDKSVLPVVGASGAGKSSFVQAGVIPRLQEKENWKVIKVRPGSSPFLNLHKKIISLIKKYDLEGFEELLSVEKDKHHEFYSDTYKLNLLLDQLAEKTKAKILLFVDQLEELFTQVSNKNLRLCFMDSICQLGEDPYDKKRVIFTLRDDFLGKAAASSKASKILSEVTVLRNPGKKALLEIITLPLELTGYRFDDFKIAREMVEEIRGDNSSLPLLQFAISELWENRDRKNKLIQRKDYEKIGGIAGALANHAENVLVGFSSQRIKLTKELLLRLVNENKTKKVLDESNLLHGLASEAGNVLNNLVKARLLFTANKSSQDEPQYEIVHESLIRNWSRLEHWINENILELSFVDDISQAASLWKKRGKKSTEIWQGKSLRDAVEILETKNIKLDREAQEFILASHSLENQKIRKKKLIKYGLLSLLVLIAVISTIISLAFAKQKNKAVFAGKIAREQKEYALKQKQIARNGWSLAQSEGAKAALLQNEMIEARAKLRVALEIKDSSLSRMTWWKLKGSPLSWQKDFGASIYELDFSPDGNFLAAACLNQNIYIINTKSKQIKVLRGHQEQVLSISWSNRGKYLASGSYSGVLALWNIEKPDLMSEQSRKFVKAHSSRLKSLDFSFDDKLIVTIGVGSKIKLWRTSDLSLLKTLEKKGANWWQVKFIGRTNNLVVGSREGELVFWNFKTGEITQKLVGHTKRITGLSIDPGGNRLASGSIDGKIGIWKLDTGKLLRTYKLKNRQVRSLHFSPDGKYIVVGDNDKSVHYFKVDENKIIKQFKAHSTTVRTVKIDPASRFLATGGSDNSVKLWKNKAVKKQKHIFQGHLGSVVGTAFSPDDKYIATGGADKLVRIWEVGSGKNIAALQGHKDSIMGVAWSKNGEYIASGGKDKNIILWDANKYVKLKNISAHANLVTELDFSPDSKYLLSASMDKKVKLWKVPEMKTSKIFAGHQFHVWTARFSSDGAKIASGSNDKTIRVWDVSSGKLHNLLKGHEDSINGLAWHPDGTKIMAGDDGKNVYLWNLPTEKLQKTGKASGRIYWVDFHPKGNQFALSGADGNFSLWHLKDSKKRNRRGHRGEINSIKYSNNGKLVVTAGDGGKVKLWFTENLKPAWFLKVVFPLSQVFLNHEGWFDGVTGKKISKYVGKNWEKRLRQTNLKAVTGYSEKSAALYNQDLIEIWDMEKDQKVAEINYPISKIIPVFKGFGFISENLLYYWEAGKDKPEKIVAALDFNVSSKEIIARTKKKIMIFDSDLQLKEKYPCQQQSAMIKTTSNKLIKGFKNGSVEIAFRNERKDSFQLETVPASPVTALLAGPQNTLIVGFEDGTCGVWSLKNGSRLLNKKLHGSIEFLSYNQGRLIAFTEFGHYWKWDLSFLEMGYCQLLEAVWKEVPVIWKDGQLLEQAPPANHPCLNK